MRKQSILVVRATSRDKIELNKSSFKNYQFHFQAYDDTILEKILCRCHSAAQSLTAPSEEINKLISFSKINQIDAIISTEDYPGCLYASVIANELNFPHPSTQSILSCSHKYISRTLQQEIVPEATAPFCLISVDKELQHQLPYPFFIKPIKSYFSIYANKVTNDKEYSHALATGMPAELFLQDLNWFLKNHSTFDIGANYLLAEELLSGIQVTLEGYVFNQQVEILGIVDSVMFPQTICFERFDYPSALPQDVQQRMNHIAKQFMQHIGFNHGIFNIEFMYNPQTDKIHIIEVNPRMSSQFADLYEKVDGFNTYQILLDIALNQQPTHTKGAGPFKVASSFVLRTFEDAMALSVPTAQMLEKVKHTFADAHIEIYIKQHQKLSDYLQDGKSYRYGIINLGAEDKEALIKKYKLCEKLLKFDFNISS